MAIPIHSDTAAFNLSAPQAGAIVSLVGFAIQRLLELLDPAVTWCIAMHTRYLVRDAAKLICPMGWVILT